jgi:hypothetical protein
MTDVGRNGMPGRRWRGGSEYDGWLKFVERRMLDCVLIALVIIGVQVIVRAVTTITVGRLEFADRVATGLNYLLVAAIIRELLRALRHGMQPKGFLGIGIASAAHHILTVTMHVSLRDQLGRGELVRSGLEIAMSVILILVLVAAIMLLRRPESGQSEGPSPRPRRRPPSSRRATKEHKPRRARKTQHATV